MSALDGCLETLEIVGLVQHLVSLRIQVSNLADVLFALRLGHSTVGPGDLGVVLNDLHRLEVTLELEQVRHDPLGGLAELGAAELVEVLKPNLLQVVLDLLRLLVTHNISDELGIKHNVIVRVGRSDELVQEFAEVVSDRKIDKNLLVERSVVLSIHGLNVLQLGEVAKGISLTHDLLNSSTILLQRLNHIDYIVKLVAVEHTSQELVKRV